MVFNAALALTNAFAHLVKAKTNAHNLPFVGGGKLPQPDEPLPSEMKEAIADYLATNQPALELLVKGLTMKSCRYPVDLTPGWDALLPHLPGLKQSAQLLALKTLLHIERDEIGASSETLQRMLSLADTVAQEPLLVSHLVRLSCYQISYPCLERILWRGPVPDNSLRRFSSLYRNLELSNGMERAIVADRCIGLQCFDYSVTQLQTMLAEHGDYSAHDFSVAAGFWMLRVSGRRDFDELYFLNCVDAYSRAAKQTLPKRIDTAEEVSDRIQEMKRSKYPYLLSGLFLPGLGKALNKDAVSIAYLRVTQTALAIERYRLAHHDRLPETLRETLPNSLDILPTDPFDGDVLRYKRLDQGFVVYSVGPDREDNGGEEEKPLSNIERLTTVRESSDITFHVAR